MTEFVIKNSDGSIGKTPAPEPTETPEMDIPKFPDIGQGADRGAGGLDPAQFSNHAYWLAHKNEINEYLTYAAERDNTGL